LTLHINCFIIYFGTSPNVEESIVDGRHTAICKDEDPELFFPVGNSGPALLQIAEAKTVCRRCPIVSDCLAWALESGQDAGVWGGMSDDERRALKHRNARTRARSNA
jgi:WhiB family redox-sensing transcriptional regulator